MTKRLCFSLSISNNSQNYITHTQELRENGLAGTPDEALETLQKWSDAGAERIYLQVLDLDDLDHIALMGREFNGKL